jgi:hypothetical protein
MGAFRLDLKRDALAEAHESQAARWHAQRAAQGRNDVTRKPATAQPIGAVCRP